MMRQNDGFVSLITSMYRKSDRPERLFTESNAAALGAVSPTGGMASCARMNHSAMPKANI